MSQTLWSLYALMMYIPKDVYFCHHGYLKLIWWKLVYIIEFIFSENILKPHNLYYNSYDKITSTLFLHDA